MGKGVEINSQVGNARKRKGKVREGDRRHKGRGKRKGMKGKGWEEEETGRVRREC